MKQSYALYLSLIFYEFVMWPDCFVEHSVPGGFCPESAPYHWHAAFLHYGDVRMGAIASQITSLAIVYSAFYSGADQRKHQSSASLAFVWGNHRDRWIPRTKGQLRGKCFHLMTSSWPCYVPYRWLIYFHRYTFPWLCVWEGCIVILLAHDKDLASLLTHPHTELPLRGKTQNVREMSDIRLPIWAVLGRVVWTDSGSCRCYHSDGFLSSWFFSSDSAQSMICHSLP